MKPDLAYGERARTGIPPNSTLVFDYEILAVKPQSFVELIREGLAAGTVDDAIARAKATRNLKNYYVSPSSAQAAANAANRKQAGEGEKVLALALTLQPKMYQLHQSIARAQAQRGAKANAIKSYETALKLNPKKTPAHVSDRDAATKALADLRK
jgi:Tfp pilus assembly protein PilF